MRFLPLFLFLVSAPALAAPNIFVIGGALSTTQQLKGCYPNYNVAGINQGGSLKGALVKALQTEEGAVLAGHSNGWSKVVVPMALSIEPKLRAKLTLVNLDGGGNANGQVAGKGFRKLRCVIAKNSGGGLSRNGGNTLKGCQDSVTITNAKAGAGWPLHFAVMNANVPANLCGPDNLGGRPAPACWWGYHGFDNCSPVTQWARP